MYPKHWLLMQPLTMIISFPSIHLISFGKQLLSYEALHLHC